MIWSHDFGDECDLGGQINHLIAQMNILSLKSYPWFPILNVHERDEFERKLDDNGKRLKGIEMELIDTKAALSSTLQNMGQRLETVFD